jgi:protein TonB
MKLLKITVLFLSVLSYLQLNAQSKRFEKDTTIYTTVEVQPSFPGGVDSLKAYVIRNAIYPEVYRKSKYEEKVFVSFVVEKDGTISNVELIQGGFAKFEKQALDLVATMPRWNPGTQNGEPVRVYFTLPIKFCPEGCAGW